MHNAQPRRYSTERLDLIASTLDHLLAELESSERLALILNAEIGQDWPPGEYDRDAQEFFRDRLREGGEPAIGWYSWYAVRRATSGQPAVVVAAAGYYGPPTEEGEVEIGYSVVQSCQRQGLAGEIVRALASIAFADLRVCRIVARTNACNQASIAVLKSANFNPVGSADESGIIRFELNRPDGSHSRHQNGKDSHYAH